MKWDMNGTEEGGSPGIPSGSFVSLLINVLSMWENPTILHNSSLHDTVAWHAHIQYMYV